MSSNDKAVQEEISQAQAAATNEKEVPAEKQQTTPVKQTKVSEPDAGAGEESRDSVVSAEGDESPDGDEEEAGDEEETDEEAVVASTETAEKNGQKANGVTSKNLKRPKEDDTEDASVQKKKKIEGTQEPEQEQVQAAAD